jgi:hypothetical protein
VACPNIPGTKEFAVVLSFCSINLVLVLAGNSDVRSWILHICVQNISCRRWGSGSCTHLWELPQIYPSGISDCIFACCPTVNKCPAFDFLVKGFPLHAVMLPCMYSFCVPFDSVLCSKSKLSRLCLLSYCSRLIAIICCCLS